MTRAVLLLIVPLGLLLFLLLSPAKDSNLARPSNPGPNAHLPESGPPSVPGATSLAAPAHKAVGSAHSQPAHPGTQPAIAASQADQLAAPSGITAIRPSLSGESDTTRAPQAGTTSLPSTPSSSPPSALVQLPANAAPVTVPFQQAVPGAYSAPEAAGSPGTPPSEQSTPPSPGTELPVPFGARAPAAAFENPDKLSGPQRKALTGILQEFQNDVLNSPPESPVWETARARADERYRILFGDAAYNARTMQAALEALNEKKGGSTGN